jgi:putative DNA primase/helicase
MKKVIDSELDIGDQEIEPIIPLTEETPLWPRPVNGAHLLDSLVKTIRRHVVVSAEAAVATAAWVMFTHANEAFSKLPMLVITSPTRGCGKSTMLTVLTCTVRRPLATSNATPAVLFRVINQESPTVLLDEADTFMTKNDALRGLIDSGHSRNAGCALRCEKGQPRKFNTASPIAIAAIGSLPTTIEDRAVVIEMRRKSASEKVPELTSDAEVEIRKLGQMAARWANDNMARIRTIAPTIPDSLHNRSEDNWRPLLAIGECAGGKWPKELRQAAVTLTKFRETGNEVIELLLLRDLKPIVEKFKNEKAIPSAMLVKRLVDMEHRPWPEINRGGPLTAPRMARILKPFGIQPGLVRVGTEVIRGYRPAQFKDAFERYVH